jgi:hypothetical protein
LERSTVRFTKTGCPPWTFVVQGGIRRHLSS